MDEMLALVAFARKPPYYAHIDVFCGHRGLDIDLSLHLSL